MVAVAGAAGHEGARAPAGGAAAAAECRSCHPAEWQEWSLLPPRRRLGRSGVPDRVRPRPAGLVRELPRTGGRRSDCPRPGARRPGASAAPAVMCAMAGWSRPAAASARRTTPRSIRTSARPTSAPAATSSTSRCWACTGASSATPASRCRRRSASGAPAGSRARSAAPTVTAPRPPVTPSAARTTRRWSPPPLDIDLCRDGRDAIEVELGNRGAGHNVPSGGVHRRMVLRAWTSGAPERLAERSLGRRFRPLAGGGKQTLSDTTLRSRCRPAPPLRARRARDGSGHQPRAPLHLRARRACPSCPAMCRA